jgi:Tol biopolymer transport system component
MLAPDRRHAAVLTATLLDVPALSIAVFDLQSRERVSRVLACTFGGSFEWVGQGPAFLARITECDDLGAVGSRSLVHVRPGQVPETLATHAEVNPRVSSMSPDGRFVAIELDGRWQLHQLASEGSSVMVLDEDLGAERVGETWSFDGSSMAYLDATTLVVRDPADTTRWSVPLGEPSLPLWSPRDARFVAFEDCGGMQRQLYLGDPQRAEITALGDCEQLYFPMWTPDAESLVLAVPCDSADLVTLEWLDLGTGERRRVAECGISRQLSRDALHWSPDGSILAIPHVCDAWRSRIRLLDARGTERAESTCVESWFGQWSPDSDMVSLVTNSSDDATHVKLLHVDGGMLDLGPGYTGDWQPGPLR